MIPDSEWRAVLDQVGPFRATTVCPVDTTKRLSVGAFVARREADTWIEPSEAALFSAMLGRAVTEVPGESDWYLPLMRAREWDADAAVRVTFDGAAHAEVVVDRHIEAGRAAFTATAPEPSMALNELAGVIVRALQDRYKREERAIEEAFDAACTDAQARRETPPDRAAFAARWRRNAQKLPASP